MLKHINTVKVYDLTKYTHFGDNWAATSYLLKESEITNNIIYFKHRWNYIKDILFFSKFFNTTGQIKSQKLNQKSIQLTDKMFFGRELLETKKVWKENNSKIIAYQFDGRHLSAIKNPKKQEIKFLIKTLIELNYKPINVGGFQPLNKIIDVISNAEFFIGCISGMMHLSMSVRIPIHVLTNSLSKHKINYLKNCHLKTAKKITYHYRAKHFLDFLNKKADQNHF